MGPEAALLLLMKCLQPLRVRNRRKAHAALDSLGWMEVHFRPEKHLILKTDGTEGPAAARDGPYRPEILGP